MAPKGKEEVMASLPVKKKQDQNAKSSQAEIAEENLIEEEATSVVEARPQPLQEIVGDRIGVLNGDFFGKCTADLINSYFDVTQDAEEHRVQETDAAVMIQCAWRRKAAWLWLKSMHTQATRIQKCYRGHLHRCYAKEVCRRVDKFLRLIYFGKNAIVIQRHFRGFYSRKYKHNFYKRKAYIERVVKVGTEVRVSLKRSYLEQMEREQEEATKNVKREIDNFIESSHFRVGTESKKGAFYSPLIAIFGRGRSYLEEHIKDARRRQVTGMEIWRKAGFDEYGIPVKMANNKFFVKQSKVPHSKLSIDTRCRVEDAALITSSLGTYITTQNCGKYVTKWELLKKKDKDKEVMIPHEKNFDTCPYVHTDYQHLEHPTVRQLSEFGQRERLRKEEQKRLELEFPNMVENPFIVHHPSGKVFDLPTVVYGKIFPKQHHHTHFPHSYADRDRRLNSMPVMAIDERIYDDPDHKYDELDHDLHHHHERVRFLFKKRLSSMTELELKQHEVDHHHEKMRYQTLLTKKCLSSMTINRRHSKRGSYVV
ncbi:unnamed protein product [Calypogeia fissa]